MKISPAFLLFILGISGWQACQPAEPQQRDSHQWKAEGFWARTSSEFFYGDSPVNCPDPEMLAHSHPEALGSHFLIEGDSISIFRYPYEYYGTFPYRISDDSLWVNSGREAATRFAIRKASENTMELNFAEYFTLSCLLPATAKYESMTPDPEMIKKLKRDSLSFQALTGKWWYLRKEINNHDGSEPLVLNFPAGMPDSIFLSPERMNIHSPHPYLELKLNNRKVKMFFSRPDEYSFRLNPEFKKDEILFSSFFDYGAEAERDTVYHEVIYWSGE